MGKASRNRRRASQRASGWVATEGARDAQRRRRHAAVNIAGNLLLRANDVGKAETQLSELVSAFQRQGATRDVALSSAYGMYYAASGVEPPYGDVAAITAAQLEEEADLLGSAELFIMSPAMQRAAIAAAETLSPVDVTTLDADEDLPSLSGVLVLAEPIVVRSAGNALSDLRAFLWRPARVFLGTPAAWSPGVRITDFLDADGPVRTPQWGELRALARNSGNQLPLLVPDQRHGLRSDGYGRAFGDDMRLEELERHRLQMGEMVDTVDPARAAFNREVHSVTAEYAGGVVDDSATLDFVQRFMFAFWRLCQQRIASSSRFADEPDAGRVGQALADARIVRLRGWDIPRDGTSTNTSRQYRHRWMVRMHKVRQWYPTEGVHKILWRGPYIKGPDGAPLLDGDKAQALLR